MVGNGVFFVFLFRKFSKRTTVAAVGQSGFEVYVWSAGVTDGTANSVSFDSFWIGASRWRNVFSFRMGRHRSQPATYQPYVKRSGLASVKATSFFLYLGLGAVLPFLHKHLAQQVWTKLQLRACAAWAEYLVLVWFRAKKIDFNLQIYAWKRIIILEKRSPRGVFFAVISDMFERHKITRYYYYY